MTEISDYLDASTKGTPHQPNWTKHPWAAAQPALHWLGVAPKPGSIVVRRHLSRDEAKLISDHMVRTFLDPRLGLVWSSYLLDSALRAIADAVAAPPEPFLESAWGFVEPLDLDRRCYEFCRALGGALLGGYRSSGPWDLTWMLRPATPSQVCLRYWTIGVKPDLWNEKIETATMEILGRYPFQF